MSAPGLPPAHLPLVGHTSPSKLRIPRRRSLAGRGPGRARGERRDPESTGKPPQGRLPLRLQRTCDRRRAVSELPGGPGCGVTFDVAGLEAEEGVGRGEVRQPRLRLRPYVRGQQQAPALLRLRPRHPASGKLGAVRTDSTGQISAATHERWAPDGATNYKRECIPDSRMHTGLPHDRHTLKNC